MAKCFCGCQEAVMVSLEDRNREYHPTGVCKRCGLIRCVQKKEESHYKEHYRNYAIGEPCYNSIEDEFITLTKKGVEQTRYFQEHIELNKVDLVYDIGCAFGSTLYFLSILGKEVYGCDLRENSILMGANEYRIPIAVGDLTIFPYKRADLIILSHVLEHAYDLEWLLHRIRVMLKETGVLYVEVPELFSRIKNNFGRRNCFRMTTHWEHLHQFTFTSLLYVMECMGFKRYGKTTYKNDAIRTFWVKGEFRNKWNYPPIESSKVLRHINGAKWKCKIRHIIAEGVKKCYR